MGWVKGQNRFTELIEKFTSGRIRRQTHLFDHLLIMSCNRTVFLFGQYFFENAEGQCHRIGHTNPFRHLASQAFQVVGLSPDNFPIEILFRYGISGKNRSIGWYANRTDGWRNGADLFCAFFYDHIAGVI